MGEWFLFIGKRRHVLVFLLQLNTGKYVVVLTFGVAKVGIDFVDVF